MFIIISKTNNVILLLHGCIYISIGEIYWRKIWYNKKYFLPLRPVKRETLLESSF
jgi:hypothetical protein